MSKLKLHNVRIAFCQNLFVKGGMPGDPPEKDKYSAHFIIDGKDTAQIKRVSDLITEIATEQWKEKAPGILAKLKEDKRISFKPGKLKTNADGDIYDGFEGNYFISAGNKKNKPVVIDRNRNIVTEDSGTVYGGCFVNVALDLWAQDHVNWGKRINAKLLTVQFVKGGDAFGNTVVGNPDDFDDLGTDETVDSTDDTEGLY